MHPLTGVEKTVFYTRQDPWKVKATLLVLPQSLSNDNVIFCLKA